MTMHEIQSWLRYWKAANSVNFDEIKTAEDLKLARKFCRVMSVGVFLEIPDNNIWYALRDLRTKFPI